MELTVKKDGTLYLPVAVRTHLGLAGTCALECRFEESSIVLSTIKKMMAIKALCCVVLANLPYYPDKRI